METTTRAVRSRTPSVDSTASGEGDRWWETETIVPRAEEDGGDDARGRAMEGERWMKKDRAGDAGVSVEAEEEFERESASEFGVGVDVRARREVSRRRGNRRASKSVLNPDEESRAKERWGGPRSTVRMGRG